MRVVACVLVAAGCGRIGFAPVAGDDVTGDDGATDAPPAVSCAGLTDTCGPTGTDPCCGSPMVSGGTFFRSHDLAPDGLYADTTHPATVSTFALDKYEITVARFRAFVDAGMGTQASAPAAGAGAHARIPGSGWNTGWDANLMVDTQALVAALSCGATQTWSDTAGPNENRPINCITWYEAMAFCIWDGGYLPSEAEWNYAAAGGSEQRAYPWSNPASSLEIDDSTYASYWVDMAKQCMGDATSGCAVSDLVVVGSKPAGDGRWSHSDLAGNVWEWVLDSYTNSYVDPCVDCADLSAAAFHVLRSSSYADPIDPLRTGNRGMGVSPPGRNLWVGARCARP